MAELLKGTKINNRYTLIEHKGSGSFGEVWLAHDEIIDSEVAVKIYISLDPRGIEEFKAEYTTVVGLSHPNLLTATYLDVWEHRPYLVMKYCSQGSAANKVGVIDEKNLLQFIHDVAAGLQYLHELPEPIIHQDIKPDNILLDNDGLFLITDFGISKKLRATMRKLSTRSVGAGATAYMGPERFEANPTPIKASDIWSLGASIYELGTGELPFSGMGGGMQRNGAEMPSLDSNWNEKINFIMQSCLAKEPWHRPTAAQLVEYTEGLIAGNDPKAPWVKTTNPGDIEEPGGETNIPKDGVHWDKKDYHKIDLDYYKDLRKLSRMIFYGGILTIGLSVVLSIIRCLNGSATGLNVFLSSVESGLFFALAFITKKAIEKRRKNAIFLSRSFLIICLLSWIISFFSSGFSIWDIVVLIYCITGLWWTFYSKDVKEVFPKPFCKHKKKDFAFVLCVLLVPIIMGENSKISDPVVPQTKVGSVSTPTANQSNSKKVKTNKISDYNNTKSTEPSKKAEKADIKDTNEKAKVDDNAQKLRSALNSGNYQQVQKLANEGYAPAYVPLAKYYLNNNDYDDADRYAQKAKAAGQSGAQAIITTLQNLGYYD